jgi:hypothetical protein
MLYLGMNVNEVCFFGYSFNESAVGWTLGQGYKDYEILRADSYEWTVRLIALTITLVAFILFLIRTDYEKDEIH